MPWNQTQCPISKLCLIESGYNNIIKYLSYHLKKISHRFTKNAHFLNELVNYQNMTQN